MSLKEKLMEDLKASMRNKDKIRKNAVTMIRAAIKQREVDGRVELEEDDVIDIILKLAIVKTWLHLRKRKLLY